MWRPIWKKNVRMGEYKSKYKEPKRKTQIVLFPKNKRKRSKEKDWYVEKITIGEWWRRLWEKSQYDVSPRTKKHHKNNTYF